MADEQYTRCPGCTTVFRVTPDQLKLREGQVRCGQCKTVFDGIAQQVSLSPPVRLDDGVPSANAAPGLPVAAQRDVDAQDAPPGSPADFPGRAIDAAAVDMASEDRFAPAPSAPAPPSRAAFYLIAIIFLLLLVAAQAAFHFRDAIATFWPEARPAFARLCEFVACDIHPLRDGAMSHLSIDASDLQADPAHKGLLILTATLRNRAGWALAYPHLELTLTDAQDRVVVRRALAPADYARGTADLQRGIAPNGEVAVKMFIDASATSQAGYRLYMFYP